MNRLRLNLDLKGVIVLIAVGVLLPVLLSTAAGIVALVLADDAGTIVSAVVVICFAAAALGSSLVAVVLTSKKFHLARRQANFLAGISHELRTPLSAIRLYTQTLQSGGVKDDPEKTAACLNTILRETEWLDLMMECVLQWRAADGAGIPLEREAKPLEEAVKSAISRFELMTTGDAVDLTVCIESRRDVSYDVRAITVVLLNLLTNAFKYSEAKTVIQVGVQDEADGVVIRVRDHGIGLSPGQLKHVFEPFFRAQQKGSPPVKGVGLGLSIARYLVTAHGGALRADSTRGEGSVFTVWLPVVGDEAA